MTINIELGPDEEEALSQRARGSGRDLTEYVHQILQEHLRATSQDERAAATPQIPDDLIDHDAIAYCEREADDTITLEEVRARPPRSRIPWHALSSRKASGTLLSGDFRVNKTRKHAR